MFDVVILDTAPLLSTNDASEIMSSADVVVLVSQAGKTSKASAARATEVLQRMEATVAGVALLGARYVPTAQYYYYANDNGQNPNRAEAESHPLDLLIRTDTVTNGRAVGSPTTAKDPNERPTPRRATRRSASATAMTTRPTGRSAAAPDRATHATNEPTRRGRPRRPVGRPSGYHVPLARPKPPTRAGPTRAVRPGSSGWALLGVVLILIALALYGLGEWVWNKHTGTGLIVAPVMVAVIFFALRRKISHETRFDIGGLVLTSIGLRLLMTYPRFGSATDAVVYNREGARLADSFRSLNFVHVDVGAAAGVPGTGSLRYIAGLVHLTTGSSFFGTTLMFGLMAFAGTWLFYRAFQVAIPDGDHYRYAKLIFLWPSLLYWPSSIGKDSWMLLLIAIASLGTARLLTRARGGYLLILVGLVGSALVRPHVTLLVFVAIGIAFIIGRRDTNRIPGQVSLGGVTKVIGIVVLLVAGSLLAPATASFLKLDDLSGDSVSNAIEAHPGRRRARAARPSRPSDPNSPIGYPIAVVTVLFRPLPGEVNAGPGAVLGRRGRPAAGDHGVELAPDLGTRDPAPKSALRHLRGRPTSPCSPTPSRPSPTSASWPRSACSCSRCSSSCSPCLPGGGRPTAPRPSPPARPSIRPAPAR